MLNWRQGALDTLHYSKHIKNGFLLHNVKRAPIGTARHGSSASCEWRRRPPDMDLRTEGTSNYGQPTMGGPPV
jgi:hypothetical protein